MEAPELAAYIRDEVDPALLESLIPDLSPGEIAALDEVFTANRVAVSTTAFGTGWEPQPKQELATVLAEQVDELLYGGAVGGGKTEWLIEYAIREMERYPGNRGVIFRRVYPSLKRTVVPRARAKLAGRATWNQNDKTFTFPNGSVLELGSLQYEKSVEDYDGAELGLIAFEEVTEFLLSQWEYMLTRLRAPADGIRAHAIATTNPGKVGHRWVKRRWIKPPVAVRPADPVEPAKPWRPMPTLEQPKPTLRVFVPATLEDNPALVARDPGYRDRVLAAVSSRGLRLALSTGDWDAIDAVEGALWFQSDFDEGRVAGLADVDVDRRVLALDPSDGEDEGDDFGVCVAARGLDGRGYVEHTAGWSASPRRIAEQVIELYHEMRCDAIVIERNHGGKWVPEVIRTVDRYANITTVWASEGKRTRAEPVAALFAKSEGEKQPRARLVGFHEEFEEQATTFTGAPGEPSPNELDAVVWAMTELLIGHGYEQVRSSIDRRHEGRR